MGRVFASSDWHGCGTVANKVLDFLKPDDKLYFLGDAIDRGPDGFKIMTKLLNDPRVTYMMGNHELMMLEALMYIMGLKNKKGSDDLWLYDNGGEATFKDMDYGIGLDLIKLCHQIKNMPFLCHYTSKDGKNIILEHAGYTPSKKDSLEPISPLHDSLWDRSHFRDKWQEDLSEVYLIHGHTPVQYLMFEYGYYGQGPKTKEELIIEKQWDSPNIQWKPEIIRYCDGHKFDIDMCTIISGRIALLDLDTFETIYFDSEVE